MAQTTQKIESLTNNAIAGKVSASSSRVDEMVRQCQKQAEDSIEQLLAQAAKAGDNPDKMRENIDAMPTDEEVEWARKLFDLQK
ncbi:hypothetical protein DHEL01_v210669 [Diaporthe helianthi]|uniref:Uncharacterized protein n=1 Tax=Diaporthe helianthi TaxID=158607 RepID=A0A2P5HKZ7_DIAHE|nr:hypothetical protein DHEL01_v210669 [Diaporthe helianthi]